MAFVNHYCKHYIREAYPDDDAIIVKDFNKWRKLNIGCGTRLDNNWINVDTIDNRLHDNVEGDNIKTVTIKNVNEGAYEGFLQHDFYHLDVLKDNHFDVIFSQHVAEHIVDDRVDTTLKQWIKLLRLGGYFYVCTPDFKFIVEDVYGPKKYFKTIDEAWVFIFNGGTHFSGHDPENLQLRLLKLGLSDVQILPRNEDIKEVKSELVLVGKK